MEKKEKLKQSEVLSTLIYLIASMVDHNEELGSLIDTFNLDDDLMYDTKDFKIDEYHNYNYVVNIVDKVLCFKKKNKYLVDVELNFSNLKVKTYKLNSKSNINRNEYFYFYCRNLANFLGEKYNNNLIFKYESSWNNDEVNDINSNDIISGDCLVYLSEDLKSIRIVETGYKNYLASGMSIGKNINYQNEKVYPLNESTFELLMAVKENILTENEEESDIIVMEQMIEEFNEILDELENANLNLKEENNSKNKDNDEDEYQIID